ncbi:MAG: PAS domain-containing protein [Pseudomonadota bacterium]
MERDHGTEVTMVEFNAKDRYRGIAAVEAYWQAIKGARQMPLRADIDPRGIEEALDMAFIVERVAAGVVRFRLAGSHLSELMGMDVRGMPLTSFFAAGARSEMLTFIEQVFTGPEILEVQLESARPGDAADDTALTAQMILLPLKSDLGDVSRAIGCLSTRGPVGHAPRRFSITGTVSRHPLGAPQVEMGRTARPTLPLPPGRTVPIAPTETAPGFAEPPAAFDPATRNAAERPWLRLVRDGEDD